VPLLQRKTEKKERKKEKEKEKENENENENEKNEKKEKQTNNKQTNPSPSSFFFFFLFLVGWLHPMASATTSPPKVFRLKCEAQQYAWGKIGSSSMVLFPQKNP